MTERVFLMYRVTINSCNYVLHISKRLVKYTKIEQRQVMYMSGTGSTATIPSG